MSSPFSSTACVAAKPPHLGLGDDKGTSTTTDTPSRPNVGSETDTEPADGLDAERRRKPKRARRRPDSKKERVPEPPSPQAQFNIVLVRAIIAVSGEAGLYRVDPFVLTLVADALGHEQGVPFVRATKKQRRDGVPAAFRVGELPKPSLWRRRFAYMLSNRTSV